MSGFLLSATR